VAELSSPVTLGGYRPLGRRAMWVQAVFVALILASLVAIGSDGAEIALLDRAISGEPVSTAEIEANDSRQAGVSLLVIAVWVVAAVVFIRWLYAAYKNVATFGLRLRFRPGWAIGAWFVPILNFWRPKQIANDIWRGSDATLAKHLDPWSQPVPALIWLWWAAWIVGLFLSRGAFRSSFSASTAEEFRTAAIVDIVGLAIEITGAVLAILFVRRATARQEACAAAARATEQPELKAA